MGERTVITLGDCVVAMMAEQDDYKRAVLDAMIERTLLLLRKKAPARARTPVAFGAQLHLNG